jgi:type I restriction enzyme, S subunit
VTELPTGWVLCRLDEVAEVRLGRQRSPKNHGGKDMRRYLRAANVDWDGLKLDDVKLMNFTDEELATYRLESGDIVLGEASGSPAEVGKPALWNGEIADCCFQNTLLRVRTFGAVLPKYLLHFLRSAALEGEFADQSRGVGIHHLGAARLSSWPITVPPLEEQRRIIEALEAHLSRTERLRKEVLLAAARSDVLRRSLLGAAFSGRLVEPDVNDEPAELLLKRIRAERATEAPRTRRTRKAKATP